MALIGGMALVGLTRPVRNVRARGLTARWRVSTWRRRIVQVADVAVSDAETLRLVNVHLSPHPEGEVNRQRELTGILERLDRLDRPARADQPGSGSAGTDRVIVAGDFNAEPGDPPIARMLSAGFSTGEKDPTKWRGTPSDQRPEREIDYVWASPGLTVTGATVPRYGDDDFARFATLSDHLPVTTTLELDAP
jgi:endonuclease/exonuclease/phosphatase family metal-dependent hydrolase